MHSKSKSLFRKFNNIHACLRNALEREYHSNPEAWRTRSKEFNAYVDELTEHLCDLDEEICSHIHPARYYAGSVKRFKAIKLAKVPLWVARMDHLDEMDRALTETLAV